MASQRVLALFAAVCRLSSGTYEWAGIFEVPDDTYMWTAQKVGGAYVDASMKMVAFEASAADSATLDSLVTAGEAALALTCTDVAPAGIITPVEGACYRLVFQGSLWQSLFTINATGVDNLALFTEHVPTEFENTAHYLKDQIGDDIEPLAELTTVVEEPAAVDWVSSVAGAILVNLCTLVGVILAAPGISAFAEANGKFVEGIFSAFAAGALLACAFFLLLFEATHLVGTGWDDEVQILWRWGTAIIAGFFLPVVIESISLLTGGGLSEPATREVNVEMGEKLDATEKADDAAGTAETTIDPSTQSRVISAVLVGDFFHNLCDGFFIGAAFKGCGFTFGWGVVAASAIHELPQELADYTILTGGDVGWSSYRALLWNFLTGLSVLLGVIIVNLADVSNAVIGLLLAFGGGTYVYLAAVVCMPKLHELKLSMRQNLGGLFAFVLGCILIGSVLFFHEHCAADGHGHGH